MPEHVLLLLGSREAGAPDLRLPGPSELRLLEVVPSRDLCQLDAGDCSDVMDWAQDFHALGSIPFGPDYNAALQAITDRFTTIDASPNRRNGSAVKQVRSNEIELRSPWELREFRLEGSLDAALLLQSTVAQTPDRRHDGSALLADFINTNPGSIKNNNYLLRLTWNDQPFRGAASRHTLDQGWDGPQPCTSVTDLRARQTFSLNTCSGCHGTPETGTQFLHVVPRPATEPAELSGFLTGITVTDPCGRVTDFNDIERRRVDLCQLLEKSCTEIEQEPDVTYSH